MRTTEAGRSTPYEMRRSNESIEVWDSAIDPRTYSRGLERLCRHVDTPVTLGFWPEDDDWLAPNADRTRPHRNIGTDQLPNATHVQRRMLHFHLYTSAVIAPCPTDSNKACIDADRSHT